MNKQETEKRVISNGKSLTLHSMFLTIQGEGPYAGLSAVFIRLAGCNLQCPLCDTDYTSNRTTASVDGIIEAVKSIAPASCDLVVITGGEPFRQNISVLCSELVKNNFTVQIETNGSLYPQGFEDVDSEHVHIVISPKSGNINQALENLPHVIAYKYVAKAGELDERDGLPTKSLDHRASPILARPRRSDLPIYLQPTDSRDKSKTVKNTNAVIKSCLNHGHTFNPQIHKMVGLP